MSIPRRLWRLARQTVRPAPQTSGSDTGETNTRHAAEQELRDFLNGALPPRAPSPPPPPPHPLARQYATLGLPTEADAETVERTWRRLVLQNHPDRFSGDASAERAAADRLREINKAHDEILAWLKNQ